MLSKPKGLADDLRHQCNASFEWNIPNKRIGVPIDGGFRCRKFSFDQRCAHWQHPSSSSKAQQCHTLDVAMAPRVISCAQVDSGELHDFDSAPYICARPFDSMYRTTHWLFTRAIVAVKSCSQYSSITVATSGPLIWLESSSLPDEADTLLRAPATILIQDFS